MTEDKNQKQPKEEITTTKFLDTLFGKAISEKASDVHIEPLRDKIRIRFRIDGRLQEKFIRPIHELEQMVNKIKVESDLDIIGKPIPQDGHFELIESAQGPEKKSRVIDVRVSVFPTIYGEAVVLRFLNREEMLMSFDEFELDPESRAKMKRLISKNYGMLLVTGPSGSGKTSLLYSILQQLKGVEKNIVTLEDPVEYHLEDIRQSPIKPDQGLTFALGMKSILRQDPDIIMIGEIRDPETAEYAIRAALMGRAVFSTVHSNSSVGIIARLIDMNIEHSLIAYALNGAISKRLVRKICLSCRITYTPDARYLEYFNLAKTNHKFIKGAGCGECGGTGYKGRIGIFEVMEIDDNLRSLIIQNVPMNVLQEYTEKAGMKTLKQDALEKVLAGETTLEEIIGAV